MSRLAESDAAALKSVIEAMPSIPPLPAGSQPVDVQFTFEYNVSHEHGGSAKESK